MPAHHAVIGGAAVEAFNVAMVVGAGELAAALEPELEGVLTAEPVAVVDTAAEVLEAGVYIGVEAMHLVQIVTVSVVKKVETLVMISMEVLPPLVWVLLDTGQLVTVVYTTSVVTTSTVEYCTGAVVLILCLLVLVDVISEVEDGLGVEDTAEVSTELEAEDVVTLVGALDVDHTIEVSTELEAENVVTLVGALDVDHTVEVSTELEAGEVLELDAVDVLELEAEVVLRLVGALDVEDTVDL